MFVVYIAAALTDAFDGIFARHAGKVRYGPEFDGLADVFFAVMTLVWIAFLLPDFFPQYWFPFLPAFVLTQGYLIIARIRQPELTLPHYEFGRFAVFLFNTLLPALIVVGAVSWFVHLVFAVSIAAKLQLIWYLHVRHQPETPTR